MNRKTAIVTGGASGIGLAIASDFTKTAIQSGKQGPRLYTTGLPR